MEPLTIIAAANTLLLVPVYFIINHLWASIIQVRNDVLKLTNEHYYLRGRNEHTLNEVKP